MICNRLLAVTLLETMTAVAQTPAAQKPAKKTSTTASKPAATAKKVSPPKSFDLRAMDKTVDACEDFYEYSCGNWRKNNPIPSDQARWGRFNELAEYNRQVLHQILEKDAVNDPQRDALTQKVGDLYASCMDEGVVNAKGSTPLKPILGRIDSIGNRDQLVDTIAYLHSVGMNVLFGFNAQPDLHNASMIIAGVGQGGIGLPDRDYYIKTDAKSQETREKYQAHVANMLKLLGDDEATAQKEAETIMGIEKQLAQASFERVKMRDPKNRDHKMPVADLSRLAPNFEFQRFFTNSGAPSFTEVNVVPPDFFQQVNGVLESVPVNDWKTYLRWHVVHNTANGLSQPFVEENFNFIGKYLGGAKELQARWKRCVQLTDRLLGEALGQPYVKQTFGADGKARIVKMVNALEESLATAIQEF